MTRRRSPLDSRNGFSTFVLLLLVQQGVATKRDGTEASRLVVLVEQGS
jgi:hypothetical protein